MRSYHGGNGQMKKKNISVFKKALESLVRERCCVMMKISTEDEGLIQSDVAKIYRELNKIIDIELKVGGPCARGDLLFSREIGISHFIAPMIESSYALHDYLKGVEEVFGAKKVFLGINIETKSAVKHLSEILSADENRRLSQITVGRGDLSKSMGRSPDNMTVINASSRVVKSAKALGYHTSIGGSIEPSNVDKVVEKIAPDFVNTRNFAFSSKIKDLKSSVQSALETEILFCETVGTDLSKRRIAALRERLKKISY